MADTTQRQTIEALPPRAKRVLVGAMSRPAGLDILAQYA
jgi:hypothetical protein